ncbi:MAG: hypothetical protein WDM91_10475 [Rhizomicrobium sp.]
MTDRTADSDDFTGILAAHPLMVPEPEDRRRALIRTAAGVAVLLVHILALVVIAYSNKVPVVKHIVHETIPEAILWFAPTRPPHSLKKEPLAPPADVFIPDNTAPITLPPITRHKELEAPQSEGLEGVGRSLACGASSYENLTVAQREHCLRHPWAFVKRPDGTIVLQAPPKPVEAAPTIPDIMRHEQQTAPPCPVLQNVPCLGRVMHGDPLGGGPQPF